MRSDRERLEDIAEAARLVREEVAPRIGDLERDPILLLATERLIEIIGEAAANISPELQASHPSVQWRGPIGIRNILAHRYFGIDVGVIRQVIEGDVPRLEQQIEAILEELE